MNAPAEAIRLTDLRYRYPDGVEALRGISLAIHEGEKVCLAGPNGAGKSTLLLCLAGLLKSEGTFALYHNKPSLPDPSVFGLVFQDPDDQLFCPTVSDDIAFGPRNLKWPESQITQSVTQALATVGLTGYEARAAHHLSGGEKKRAAIASVIACNPAILALDEPWANLDAHASQAITTFLTACPGTLLIASQDLYHAANVCTRLILLDQGTVVADFPMTDLLKNKTLLENHGLEFGARCRFCFAKQEDSR